MRALKLLLMALGAVVLLAVGIAAVGSGSKQDPDHPAVAVVVHPAPVPVQSALPRRSATLSVASFSGDRLDECDDFTLTGPPDAGDGTLSGAIQKLRKKVGKTTEIRKTCAEQFLGRSALATCTVNDQIPGKPDWDRSVVARYYNVKTASDSDIYMKQCIEMGGDWKVSEDADTEVLRQRVQQHHKMLESLATPP